MAVILSVKLKNAIKKEAEALGLDVGFKLTNTVINGDKRGCTGFIYNKENNSIVYVNTEETPLASLHFMYRYADHLRDFSGYHNRWANTLPELVSGICSCSQKTPKEAGEHRMF